MTKDSNPPEKLKRIDIIRPVSNAERTHLETSTRKQSLFLKKLPFVSINKTTIFARPIFAPGINGKEGMRSSTANKAKEIAVNKAQITIRPVFFTLSPHLTPIALKLQFQACEAYR